MNVVFGYSVSGTEMYTVSLVSYVNWEPFAHNNNIQQLLTFYTHLQDPSILVSIFVPPWKTLLVMPFRSVFPPLRLESGYKNLFTGPENEDPL